MYLIQVTESNDDTLIGTIWEIDEKGENAVCIEPKDSIYCINKRISTDILGTYSSIRLERLNEDNKNEKR